MVDSTGHRGSDVFVPETPGPPMRAFAGGGAVVWGGWAGTLADVEMRAAMTARARGCYEQLTELGYDLRDWPIDVPDFHGWMRTAADWMGIDQPRRTAIDAETRLVAERLEHSMATRFTPAALSEGARIRNGISAPSSLAAIWPWRALHTGSGSGVELRTATRVVRVDIGRRSATSLSLRYYRSHGDHLAGPFSESYEAIGLACGAIQTVRLLLVSLDGERGHPSLTSVGTAPLFHLFGPRMVLAGVKAGRCPPLFYRLSEAAQLGSGILSLHARPKPVLTGTRTDSYDPHTRVFELRFTGSDMPSQRNHIELDTSRRDAAGVPAARVRRAQSTYEAGLYRHVTRCIDQRLRRAGFEVAERTTFAHDWRVIGDHQMGGCVMGTDPTTSVTTPQGRLHAVPNIFVLDGSVFPSCPGFFPTVPIVANALRVAASF